MPSWLRDTIEPDANSKEEASAAAQEVPTPSPKASSVSQINAMIKSHLEASFGTIWVKGEISNFTNHRSGHYYFSLKDDRSQISAVMFRGMNSKLRFLPENGMEVIVQAKVAVYEPRGSYQLMCQSMEAVGAGSLQKAYEQLKAKLKQEGLFAQEHKKSLPKLPAKVAIITSPTGAAIRDMLNVLSRRASGLEILLIPALVQGEAAAPSLIEAIKKLKLLKDIDVAIIGRGGGSVEDLWAFNNEALAREIYSLNIPIVSAVGHEIDFTICDFVADLRAPTPSAAAELIVANKSDMLLRVNNAQARIQSLMQRQVRALKEKSYLLQRRLVSPQKYLEQISQRVDELDSRLLARMQEKLKQARQNLRYQSKQIPRLTKNLQLYREQVRRLVKDIQAWQGTQIKSLRKDLNSQMAMLDSLSPLNVLDRGYAITFKKQKVVKRAKELKKEEEIEIRYADKTIGAKVTKI